MSTLPEIAQALADALAPIGGTIEKLQIVGVMVPEPTPPAIDIYPGDPFRVESTMVEPSFAWVVRARATTADHEAGQLVLLQLMEEEGGTSVQAALLADPTLGGVIGNLTIEGPSGYQAFADPGGAGFLIGVQWRVEVYPG